MVIAFPSLQQNHISPTTPLNLEVEQCSFRWVHSYMMTMSLLCRLLVPSVLSLKWKDLAVEPSKVYQLSSDKAMEKEENYPVPPMATSFTDLEYNNLDNLHHNHQQQQHHHQQHHISSGFYGGSTSMDKVSFAEVMQFADFGPKLGLTQNKIVEEYQSGMDPIYFLKFPVLNDKVDDQSLMASREEETDERFREMGMADRVRVFGEEEEFFRRENSDPSSVQLRILEEDMQINNNPLTEGKNKRKRPRTIKTSEEVESQRMTHIAVERNRRKQMNEHLRVLRSLMPGSYVQRGDQASIIGGAIEFVRELEQLLQCLESQKRRRIMGEAPRQIGESSTVGIQQNQPPFFPPLPLPNEQLKIMDFETGLREETAENKSGLADVEVKLLGFDAMIKILSRRRPGQLIKTIAALEDLQLNILHTNITTIEQTVLYSFNVKVAGESRFSAEDIATSVQQIFSFINANNA